MMTEQASKHDPQTPRAPACQAQARQTALHRAAAVGNSDAMAALLQGGCAVDLQERVSSVRAFYMEPGGSHPLDLSISICTSIVSIWSHSSHFSLGCLKIGGFNIGNVFQ